MHLLGVLGLTGLLAFGVVSQAMARDHDGLPPRREGGGTRVHKQPPPVKKGRVAGAIVVTPLFAVGE